MSTDLGLDFRLNMQQNVGQYGIYVFFWTGIGIWSS